MALTCNINKRGQWARLLVGFLVMFVASILFVLGIPSPSAGWRTAQGLATLLGVFMMFEGVMGWCALKALFSKSQP